MKANVVNKLFLKTFIVVSWFLLPGSYVLAQSPSLSDCRAIEDTLARFDCYEQLEEADATAQPSNQGAAPSSPGATRANPARTQRPAASQGLPVIRRPNSAAISTDDQEDTEQEQNQTTAVIERGSESRPFYRRIWPFGGDDEDEDREEVAAESDVELGSSDIDTFGLPNTRVQEDEDGKLELHDTVAAIEYLRPSVLQITLASGQVWRQMESKRYLLKEGDEVRIYTTFWGNNYRLTTERLKSYIQVARIE